MSMNKHDDEWFSTFVREVMNLKRSIRWVGIANQLGMIIKETYRECLRPLLTAEENLEYAANTIARQKERIKYEQKIGKLEYTLVKYKKANRIMIPLNNNNNYLLFSIDVKEIDYDKIIKEKIIPFVEGQEASK
jgi:hypothetical protein